MLRLMLLLTMSFLILLEPPVAKYRRKRNYLRTVDLSPIEEMEDFGSEIFNHIFAEGF